MGKNKVNIERVKEVSRLIDQESIKLKRHNKFSKRKTVLFWDAVWDVLKDNPDLMTEDAITHVKKDWKLIK